MARNWIVNDKISTVERDKIRDTILALNCASDYKSGLSKIEKFRSIQHEISNLDFFDF